MQKLGSFMKARIGAFVRSRDGVFPVLFAITIVPILGLVGMSVDYAGARVSRAQLQSAADAAVLEAVTTAEKQETAAGNDADFKRTDDGYAPIARGRALFTALVGENTSFADVKITIEVSREGDIFRAKGGYVAEYKTRMPNPITSSGINIEGVAQSTTMVSGSGHMEIYTLLDTSGSMGIGATKADIDRLKNEMGCAFSCHGEKPAGVQLRIDVMRDAVRDMINTAEAEWKKDKDAAKEKGKGKKDALTPRIKIALNKFDHEPTEIEKLTSDYKRLRDDIDDVKLLGHRGTNAKRAIDWLTPKVPNSGSGLSADSPRRFVFIVTDGLQDRYPAWAPVNFPAPSGANWRTGPIDPAACNALKAKGVIVGILYTTQVGIPGYEWYWQNPQPAIRPNLQACASPNYFFEASNATQLSEQFKVMFKKAVEASMARLEK